MIFWLCFLALVALAKSARILAFFPQGTPSHHFIFRPVIEGLAKNGHDVVYVSAFPYKELPENITQIDLSNYDIMSEFADVNIMDMTELNIMLYTIFMYSFGELMARYYVGSKEVQDLIHSDQKFDAVMFESYFYQEYLSAFIHKFNAIPIEVLTLGDCAWVNEMSGLQDNPSYQVDFKSGLSGDLSFWQKLHNVYATAFTIISNYFFLHYTQQSLMDLYFNYTGWESRPSIGILAKNRSLILTNFDHVFAYPYPMAPHRKDIGGINIKPPKPLPEDLQKYIDESEHGLIYMSMGSHIDPTHFKDQIKAFLEVFSELPQRILLKYDPEKAGEIPPNVKVSKWLPQQDILAHKKCVLFITHGGLLSLSEAIYNGVPLIGIPIFADQPKNMAMMESQGIGRMLKMKNITRDTISWTIREVLSNNRYRDEILRRSKILKDRRNSPVEEAVYWIEHTLKYPFSLTPKSTNLSAIEFHLIDVKIFITLVLILVLYMLYSGFTIAKKIVLRAIRKPKQNIPVMTKGNVSLLLLLALAAYAESARMLAFFPMPARSHHFVFRPILEELAKRGHEIVYVTGFQYDKEPKGITQIPLPAPKPSSSDKFSWVEFGEANVPITVIALYEIFLSLAPLHLGNPRIQELIHSNEKFDAVLVESYFVQEYLSAFLHKFGAVGIEIMPLGDCAWVNELSGLPDNPAYQLDYKYDHTNDLTFFEKLYNIYVTTTLTLFGYYYLHKQQAVADTYMNYTGWETRPPLYKMVSNRSIILTNSHFALGYPAPAAPHKKEIGGINIRKSKPLPKDLQTYMDQSKQGVIYMSLGSNMNVSDIATENIREDFMSVFKELPYNVLMKWETDYPGKLPPNVKTSSWFPQQDILAHKNCVLFITHGGYLSISEAVHFGVPLVGIPIFGDQAKNLVLVEDAGYGRTLKFRNITRDTVAWTVNEVLSNKRYKEEALRRSKIFRDRILSPAEEAAYWIEHAIKYPNALTPKGAWLTFVQLHLIDVKLFILATVICLLCVACKLLTAIGKLCKSKPNQKQEAKKKLKKN
nr:UDP-glucuronosyltransferase 2B17-like [Halyomorpha halys]